MKPAPAQSQSTVSKVVATSDAVEFTDLLAVEEPLEIRLQLPGMPHRPISITMRTPGHDLELAAGFLFTEGIVKRRADIRDIRHCGPKGRNTSGSECAPEQEAASKSNTVVVELADGVEVDLKRLKRNFYTTSSCGVCGKSSIEALQTGVKSLPANGVRVANDLIHRLPTLLRNSQSVFECTGGLHASALFDIEGTLDIVREDVGRHNALDKVIGAKFLANDVPLATSILLVSGRASFELVQKALMAGIPVMAAVGAPSSLAVELAAEYGMTLIGFVRDGRFNIYSGRQRASFPMTEVN